MNSSNNSTLRTLGMFSLIMITVGSVDSIRNLPATALFGSSLIFFFLISTVIFLLPCALVSAELSSAWTKDGGIYVWVKEAFGQRVGFLAVWFQWIENVIWYPTILSFVAGTIGYLIAPELAESKYFLMAVILCAFWFATIVNLYGIESSAWFASFCGIFGLIVPMILIIGLGVSWVMLGEPMQVHFTAQSMLPSHNSDMWVSLIGIMLSFSGMEIATVHVRDVKNPQRSYPMAMLYASIIIVVTLLFGSLSIAVVMPHQDISLVAGLMQAFEAFFNMYHMHWILPLIAVMLVVGGMGSVSNWIIAPTRGLLIAGKDGNLPLWLQTQNAHRAPKALLIYQAIIVTFLAFVFLTMPSINGSYWLLTALAAQLYMFMYILMFAAGIRLRYSHAHVDRPFSVPGGNWGMWLVCLLGLVVCIATVVVGFIPPSDIDFGSTEHYEVMLTIGLLIMSLPPYLMYWRRKDSWITEPVGQ